tara:strand:- start:114 stop:428 length:315 start_codon:yes stop_codon:yes gene_type:complete
MIKSIIDKNIKLIVNKVAYNRNINQQVKPFKDKLIKNLISILGLEEKIFKGNIGEIKLVKVTRPYVNLDKILANTKDAKKYVTYKESYRLTAREYDVVELKEAA